jgi:hypothetical protein
LRPGDAAPTAAATRRPGYVRFRPIADIREPWNKLGMHVKVFAEDRIIGTAFLDRLDRSMGCAMGTFTATSSYAAERHASCLNGEYVGDDVSDPARIRVRTAAGESVEALAVCILDFSDSLGPEGMEVDVVGIPAAAFARYFGAGR